MDVIDQHQAAWRKFRAQQKASSPSAAPATSSRSLRRMHSVRRPSSTGNVSGNVSGSEISATNLMEVKLQSDLHRLSLQPSRQKRHALQKKLLPDYADYLQKAVAEPQSGDDPVLVQCMIWAFNLGDLEQAWRLAQHAIDHALSMPDNFKTNVQQFACREIAYWALAEQKAQRSPEPYLSAVFERSRIWDKPDQIEARLLKAMGQQRMNEESAESKTQAREYFEQALALDKGVGVKNMIKRLSA